MSEASQRQVAYIVEGTRSDEASFERAGRTSWTALAPVSSSTCLGGFPDSNFSPLRIPWSNLKGKPVKVVIEDVFLLAAPRSDQEVR